MTGPDLKQQRLAAILAATPVMPVVTIADPATAVPSARALAAGGVAAIEVALRTPAALDAIRAIASALPTLVVGAGTVLDVGQLEFARAAGAAFAVSPGFSPGLLDAADDSALPLLPGVATIAEAQCLLERGYRYLKFFPAVAAGGVPVLAAWHAPLPQLRFCPAGGIDATNAAEFLALPNVVGVGGSWLAPASLIAAHAFACIETLAREAKALGARARIHGGG